MSLFYTREARHTTQLTVSAWNCSNRVLSRGGTSFQVCFNLVMAPSIRPIVIAKNEFKLLKFLQLQAHKCTQSVIHGTHTLNMHPVP